MREISVFDVVGPNMIGPSSSHTAGALRIALMAGKISKGKPKKVKFILYGSFAMTYKGHGTDKALLAGILGMNTEDYRIRDSFRLADEAGIEYEFVPCTENKGYHPSYPFHLRSIMSVSRYVLLYYGYRLVPRIQRSLLNFLIYEQSAWLFLSPQDAYSFLTHNVHF